MNSRVCDETVNGAQLPQKPRAVPVVIGKRHAASVPEPMSGARQQLPLWLGLHATALLALAASRRREPAPRPPAPIPDAGAQRRRGGRGRRSASRADAAEPFEVRLRRAQEARAGRAAEHPLQMPPQAWKDILWRSFKQMNANRLLAIAGGVAFFVSARHVSRHYGVSFRPSACC